MLTHTSTEPRQVAFWFHFPQSMLSFLSGSEVVRRKQPNTCAIGPLQTRFSTKPSWLLEFLLSCILPLLEAPAASGASVPALSDPSAALQPLGGSSPRPSFALCLSSTHLLYYSRLCISSSESSSFPFIGSLPPFPNTSESSLVHKLIFLFFLL